MATEAPVIAPPTTPKYSPRAAAADFTVGLPKLGVEITPEPAAIAPVAPPEKPEPTPEVKPVAPPIKPPEVPPVITPAPAEPIEVKIPRNAKDWDAYKAAEKVRLDAKESEVKKWREEAETLRKAPPVSTVADDDPRIVEAKKTADELSEQLRLVDITNHPKFKAFYENKVNTQIEMAKRVVGTDNADAIATLLKLPDNTYRQERIDEIVATLSPIQQSRIGAVINSLAEIETDRTAQIEQAKTDFVAYQEKAKKTAETQMTEAKTKGEAMFGNVVSALQNPKDKDGLFIFQKLEGNEEWNKGVDERISYARGLFTEKNPQVLIRAALHAAALPGVVKSYQTLLSKVQGLQEQVKGMTAAQPALKTSTTAEGGDKIPSGQTKKKTGFLDGRGQAGEFIKSLNETQSSMAEA